MTNPMRSGFATRLALGLGVLLSGCTSINFEQTLAKTNQETAALMQGQLSGQPNAPLTLAQTQSQRTALLERASQLLAQPLNQNDAVQLALANSPALQEMLAQAWANSANAVQAARIANPAFTLSRVRSGDDYTFERTLSVGLLDILLLPQRQRRAQRQIDQTQLLLTAQVISQIGQVRQAWVNAVAAQQSLIYAKQVFESAEASAELAKRMQAAGNFNKLLRARQQLFYADAATRLANAQHKLTATREQLVRALGLDAAQAEQMQLPNQLPALPDTPRQPEEVSQSASNARLDIRLAQAALAVTTGDKSWPLLNALPDTEFALRRNTVPQDGKGVPERGFEVTIKLPLFDLDGSQAATANAQTLAAANRLQTLARNASSHPRENYSAYRTRFDLAKHYREELVPLRKTIADENVLRYNGMLVGVFELLADAREQISSVLETIEAEQQFWLANSALEASILGLPANLNNPGNSADDNNGSSK